MRYFITFSYLGKQYHGWQKQPNALTVQQILEASLATLLKKPIPLLGAGRTDTGVHAKQMVAHFDMDEEIVGLDLVHRLNSLLPDDIAIYKIFRVPDEMHARFDAVERTYEYWITEHKNPFYLDSAHYVKNPLNLELLNKAASVLLEYTDFECFSKSNTDVKTYRCQIKKAVWSRREDKVVFTITADRFLRNMVRAIVGTLLEINSGKLGQEEIKTIIESKNRSNAGFSAPAKGLYLVAIKYPENSIQHHGE